MKIKAVTVNRFRGYSEPVIVGLDDLSVLVGRNDIGKSTILEALDVFFNEGKGCIKGWSDQRDRKTKQPHPPR
ncbi:AAA family ATPase [Xanthomonas vasicola]|uniref:AAA family ATPase n=1 Tax=Xanthomonas vasicola TaxID=56459 RepID=UPI00069B8EBD|nr:AAA family ATPase [Xanthomonas vasicola]MDO6986083.1 AAA family ATPase [Xanthomonas vasicola]